MLLESKALLPNNFLITLIFSICFFSISGIRWVTADNIMKSRSRDDLAAKDRPIAD